MPKDIGGRGMNAASKLHTDYRDERRFDPPSLLLLSGRAKVRAAASLSLLAAPGPSRIRMMRGRKTPA